MPKRKIGFNCQHPDCIYRGKGTEGTHYANCDYFMHAGKLRSTQKGGERAETCTLYTPPAEGQKKPRINRNPSVPQWDTLAMSLYEAGKSDESIAKAVGMSKATIVAWRLRRQLKPVVRRTAFTTFDNEKALKMYRDGLSDLEIGRAVGASVQTIGNWRRANGLPSNFVAPGPRSLLDWDLAMKLYEQGLSDKRIAEQLGCDHRTVNRWRHKNYLPSKHKFKKKEEKHGQA